MNDQPGTITITSQVGGFGGAADTDRIWCGLCHAFVAGPTHHEGWAVLGMFLSGLLGLIAGVALVIFVGKLISDVRVAATYARACAEKGKRKRKAKRPR